ncbi:Sodium/hydrogen exchanger 4 [Liparis tanakae]|uniref:Sodium/hydrogen exchanger 4 n=1 Tax=Liparis tanakae TaxID=230148 RepID=A0A4Z2E1U1_9TELE|nr:Sodium/hydrogen exchanger 4 [Liparis tanakae]
MQDILSKNMYKIRQKTMNYTNKYNLPDDSPTREILIRRHASVRRSLRAESLREPVSLLVQVSVTPPPAGPPPAGPPPDLHLTSTWPSPDLHLTST